MRHKIQAQTHQKLQALRDLSWRLVYDEEGWPKVRGTVFNTLHTRFWPAIALRRRL